MTRKQLEKIAMDHFSKSSRARPRKTLVDLAIMVHDLAKEEDAVIASTDAIDRCFRHQEFQKGACGHDIRDAIRALKVK